MALFLQGQPKLDSPNRAPLWDKEKETEKVEVMSFDTFSFFTWKPSERPVQPSRMSLETEMTEEGHC